MRPHGKKCPTRLTFKLPSFTAITYYSTAAIPLLSRHRKGPLLPVATRCDQHVTCDQHRAESEDSHCGCRVGRARGRGRGGQEDVGGGGHG